MAQVVKLAASGLNISANPLQRPEGALNEASDVIIRRDGVVESRRGFPLYTSSPSSNFVDKILEYRQRLITHNQDSYLEFDNGSGTFTRFNGTYPNLDGNNYKVKGQEFNGNFYITTGDSVKKLSAANSSSLTATSVLNAGVPKALAGTGTAHTELGDIGSFLKANSKVAYRIVWGYKDDNNNTILGTPSDRIVASNSKTSLEAQDVLNLYKILVEMGTIEDGAYAIRSLFPYLASLPQVVSPAAGNDTCQLVKLNVLSDEQIIYNALNELIYYLELNMVLAHPLRPAQSNKLRGPLALKTAEVKNVGAKTILNVKFTKDESITTLVPGVKYSIVTSGSPSFTTVGAVDNNVGTTFIATSAGTGTGVAREIGAKAGTYFTVGQHVNLINFKNPNSAPSGLPIAKDNSDLTTNPNINDLNSFNFVVSSVASNIATHVNEIDVDITTATSACRIDAVLDPMANQSYITIGDLTANYTPDPTQLDTLLTNTLTAVRDYMYRGLAAGNMSKYGQYQQYIASGLIDEITGLSIDSASSVATITFAKDPSEVFKIGDIIEVTGMKDSAGTSIDGQKIVKSLSTGAYTYPWNMTFETSGANGVGTHIDSSIYKTIIISDETYKKYIADSTVTPAVYLRETTSSSVDLSFQIPADITLSNPKYFYQIYRSRVKTADISQSLSDIVPDDELRLLYEGFPTQPEITARLIEHNDDVDENLLSGPYLYTNSLTGQGIVGANAPIPYAKDVNRFKNRMWYANTRTNEKMLLTFLGTNGIVDGDKLTIASLSGSNTYSFVTGVNQTSSISINKKAILEDSILSISSTSVCQIQTLNAHNLETGDYVNIYLSYTIPSLEGYWKIDKVDSYSFNIPVHVTYSDLTGPVTRYVNQAAFPVTGVVGTIYVASDVSAAFEWDGSAYIPHGKTYYNYNVAPVKASDYVKLYSANDEKKFVFWFSIDGVGSAPNEGTDAIYIELALSHLQDSFEVMDVLTAAISGTGYFSASSSLGTAYTDVPTISITNLGYGAASSMYTNNSAAFNLMAGTIGAGEDWLNKKILKSPAVSASTNLIETTNSLINVINKNAELGAELGSEQVYAYSLFNDTTSDISSLGSFYLEAKTLSTNPIYVIASSAALGVDFNAPLYVAPSAGNAGNITATTAATATVITSVGHGLVTGNSVIITNTNPVVDGLHSIIKLTDDTFSIPVTTITNGTTGYWVNETQAEMSSNDKKSNRIFYSKYLEPEAVPILNSIDVGVDSKEILRIFPLRDSLFVFKEDGLFRISGETEPFSLGLFDSSCICNAEESLAVANNVIYLSTTQGISAVTESGVEVISRAIDVDILKFATFNHDYYKSTTFALGYDSDNSYYIWMPNTTTATCPNVCYRYSNLTNSWTTFNKINTAGLVNSTDDKLYLAAGDIKHLERERKIFDRTDYSDREYIVNITNISELASGIITLSDCSNVNTGDVILQGSLETPVVSVDIVNSKVTLLDKLAFTVAPCTIYTAIDCTLIYAPQTMGDALLLKHMRETTMMFENSSFSGGTLSYSSDLMPSYTDVDFQADGVLTGSPNSAPIRTYVPRDNQRCRYLMIKFNHRVAREKFSILGTSLVASDSTSSRGYR